MARLVASSTEGSENRSSEPLNAGLPPEHARRGWPRGDAADQYVAGFQRDDFDRDVWCLLGLPIDVATVDQAVSSIDMAVREKKRLSFVTPNVNWLVRALRDREHRRQILEADLSVVDGAPLVYFARNLGIPLKGRTAGSDIFEALRRRPGYAGRRTSVFLFGGRENTAARAAAAINEEKGGVEVVGWRNPGFGNLDSMCADHLLDEINAKNPDFVVVALGAVKGQAWIDRNQDRLTAPVIAHLGAVVDFSAGSVRRAPIFLQKLGLEWAWRIKEEPTLWRRYFEDVIALMGIAITKWVPQSLAGRSDSTAESDRSAQAIFSGDAIRLRGALVHPALRTVREAFRQAAEAGKNVTLDISDVETLDRAFLGLVLMLEKHLARRGATISIHGASRAQLMLFAANTMRYPVAGSPEVEKADPPAARAAAT